MNQFGQLNRSVWIILAIGFTLVIRSAPVLSAGTTDAKVNGSSDFAASAWGDTVDGVRCRVRNYEATFRPEDDGNLEVKVEVEIQNISRQPKLIIPYHHKEKDAKGPAITLPPRLDIEVRSGDDWMQPSKRLTFDESKGGFKLLPSARTTIEYSVQFPSALAKSILNGAALRAKIGGHRFSDPTWVGPAASGEFHVREITTKQ